MVAITIDDVPNFKVLKKGVRVSPLLEQLDKLKIPVTIFINGNLVYQKDEVVGNFGILNNWISRNYVSPGNHTFSHSRYSEVGLKVFLEDVDRGSWGIRELAVIHNKKVRYFRFPYNDLGKDKVQHEIVKQAMVSRNYQVAPFTVESSDWIFNSLYRHYLKKGMEVKARWVGEEYVKKSLQYFEFFENLCKKEYGREVRQIYLCHDNPLNSDYLGILLKELQKRGYSFISMDEAMEDDIYKQKDSYHKKWGLSWLYRWMDLNSKRVKYMKSEPSIDKIYKEYKKVSSKQ